MITSYPRCNNKAGPAPPGNVVVSGLSMGWTHSVLLAVPAGEVIRAVIKSGGVNSRDVRIVKGRNVFSFLSLARTLCPAVTPAPAPGDAAPAARQLAASQPLEAASVCRGAQQPTARSAQTEALPAHQKPMDLCLSAV